MSRETVYSAVLHLCRLALCSDTCAVTVHFLSIVAQRCFIFPKMLSELELDLTRGKYDRGLEESVRWLRVFATGWLVTHRHRAAWGIAVCEELIHRHSKRPDVRCPVELAVDQALWSIPGERREIIITKYIFQKHLIIVRHSIVELHLIPSLPMHMVHIRCNCTWAPLMSEAYQNTGLSRSSFTV